MFEAYFYHILFDTQQPSNTCVLHGHHIKKDNTSLNVCEEYEILNPTIRPIFGPACTLDLVCVSSFGYAWQIQTTLSFFYLNTCCAVK